jgi:hypothetical protein
MRFVAALLLVTSLCFGIAPAIAAEPAGSRVALVIGNAAYQAAPPLRNTRNDADDVSAELKHVGFDVLDGRDLTRDATLALVRRFAQRLRGSDAALVYYSGHGLQIDGRNYLVPVDANFANGVLMSLELVKVEDVIEALGYTDGVRILILDACRDSPFPSGLSQNQGKRGIELTRGLARIERSQGMLIAYSTQPNSVAVDGDGRNSPFSAALVSEIPKPGVEIATLFRRVAIEVNRETDGRQTPELSVSLLRDFYFNPQESDVDAWKKLGPSAGIDELKAFVGHFPSSMLVDAVRARIDALESANQKERLISEYSESERRLKQDLERAEAGYKQATEELASIRAREDRDKPPGAYGAAGGTPTAVQPPTATPKPEQVSSPSGSQDDTSKRDEAVKAKKDELASAAAAYDADRARVGAERASLEKAMAESIARAQAQTEEAQKRLQEATVKLPPSIAARPIATSAPTARRRPASCEDVIARSQVGDLSDSDRNILQNQCR